MSRIALVPLVLAAASGRERCSRLRGTSWARAAARPDLVIHVGRLSLSRGSLPRGRAGAVVLSGHTHLFERLELRCGPTRPLQIVAGDGGTNLADPVPGQMKGMEIRGVMVAAGENQREFGFTVFTRRSAGWEMRLKELDSAPN